MTKLLVSLACCVLACCSSSALADNDDDAPLLRAAVCQIDADRFAVFVPDTGLPADCQRLKVVTGDTSLLRKAAGVYVRESRAGHYDWASKLPLACTDPLENHVPGRPAVEPLVQFTNRGAGNHVLRRYAAGITTISSPTHALALAPIAYEEKQWQPLGLVTIALVSIGLLLSAALLLLTAFHIAAGVRGDEDKDLLHHDDADLLDPLV